MYESIALNMALKKTHTHPLKRPHIYPHSQVCKVWTRKEVERKKEMDMLLINIIFLIAGKIGGDVASEKMLQAQID